MKFLIQHNLINEKQLIKIKSAINNYPHEFIGVIPFSHELTSEFDLSGTDFIPYGSTLLTTLALEQHNWKGLHFNLENFDYEKAAKNRNDMLNYNNFNGYCFTVKEAIEFLKTQHKKHFFIRPSLDLKHFSGTVMKSKEMHEWLEDAMLCDSSGSYKLDEDMKVIISNPKNIQAEWRWFIIDGKIVDGSMYKFRDRLRCIHEDDEETIKEAQSLAEGWLPDKCCCMDTALVDDEIKVIEFNCINSSGFYDNNIDKIFKAWYEYHNK